MLDIFNWDIDDKWNRKDEFENYILIVERYNKKMVTPLEFRRAKYA